jgi:hypothetical protein
MARKVCLYERAQIDKPPRAVKCGSMRELNAWARRKKLKWQPVRSWMFGGYWYAVDGTSYEFDMKDGYHIE